VSVQTSALPRVRIQRPRKRAVAAPARTHLEFISPAGGRSAVYKMRAREHAHSYGWLPAVAPLTAWGASDRYNYIRACVLPQKYDTCGDCTPDSGRFPVV